MCAVSTPEVICLEQENIQNRPHDVMKRRVCPVGRDKASTSKEIKPCSGSDDAQNKRLLKKHINHQNAASYSNTFALLHENGIKAGSRRGRKLKVLLADDAKWSQEQIDFAIKESRLTPGFRTRLCSSIHGEEPCRLGSQCQNAHSPAELRVKAAIEMGYLPDDYKTAFWELCTNAHGRKQLRLEAAVQLAKVAADFKTALCDMWCLEGRCSFGSQCPAAHGVSDMRVQAALNAGTIKDVFKTQRCFKANCKRLHCTYYHDESDQLPLIGYKAQYCIAHKETGQCPYGTKCHFAHDSSELVNVDISANFVTRSVENDDTESMLSTDTAQSKDITRDARAGGAVVPLAVSSGRMPVAAPKAAVKQRRRKGGPELRLCRKFQETGNCTDPNCRLVHGEDDLNRRQGEAMGGNRQSMPTFNSANVPAPRVFSPQMLEAIQTYKLSACVDGLKSMGFSFENASKAARMAAGDADHAIELLMSGQVDHAGIPEMTVQTEVDELCCIANALNISTADIEAAVLSHYGNHHAAMKVLQARDICSANPTEGQSGGSYNFGVPPIPEADSDADEFTVMERRMWADVKKPTWEEGSHESSSSVSTRMYLPEYTQKAAEEAPEPQSAAEETAWQEYRPEDFGIDVAAEQPGQEDEDALLRAAIQASKADALAQKARFTSANGGGSHRVLADVMSNGPAANGASHRTWFPPAEKFVSKAGPSGPTGEGAGQPEANSGVQKEGSEDTYTDVMSFLLGS
ncbi:g4381 [Coccomyxa viridis]|uniref:G4381 protein n=1 Tax=Coccomyxa viridis TaxID=1274662 RepID=A0ABP1FU49_9CHLO